MIEYFKKFNTLLFPIVVLILVAILFFTGASGDKFVKKQSNMPYLPAGILAEKKMRNEMPKTCLILADTSQEEAKPFLKQIKDVLSIMRVGYEVIDLNGNSQAVDFSAYKTCVVVFPDLDVLGENAMSMSKWVKDDGGRTMFMCSPFVNPLFRYLSDKVGIQEGGTEFRQISGLRVKNNFMLGGDGFVFHWGDPMATALNVKLRDDAEVYVESDGEEAAPLLWSCDYGKGRFVVCNHGIVDKSTRGLTSSAYALLEDVSIYPVINASVFFIDDFPSPVPMGDSRYIRKSFDRDISSFYSNIWWPNMLELCEDYGIRFTGVVIESYEQDVTGNFPKPTDIERFNYFGKTLLENGGEIGFHGYNHVPLCLKGFDFMNQVKYPTWTNEQYMAKSITELDRFINELFPNSNPSCYVPPSNILSKEGRAFLKSNFPQIKTISSLYLEGDIEYAQEFEVASDGIIELPRVIAGATFDEFTRWQALNALNMYYINSHFIHPDDVLDVDRGAEMGWTKLFGNLRNYCDWLYTAVPDIRNTTASEAAKAVQRFDTVSIEREDHEDYINLRIGGLYDEAYFIVRLNSAEVTDVQGGTIEPIDRKICLLKATSSNVKISIRRN